MTKHNEFTALELWQLLPLNEQRRLGKFIVDSKVSKRQLKPPHQPPSIVDCQTPVILTQKQIRERGKTSNSR